MAVGGRAFFCLYCLSPHHVSSPTVLLSRLIRVGRGSRHRHLFPASRPFCFGRSVDPVHLVRHHRYLVRRGRHIICGREEEEPRAMNENNIQYVVISNLSFATTLILKKGH